ncbi:MAG: caspase family protein [Rhodocyclaceae bacterium]|nr:caspase family protein [Rhodocyclaceae bacterium]
MKTFAIVVGINTYDRGLPLLAGAVADAYSFAEWLLDPTKGGVTPEDLLLWVEGATGEEEIGPNLLNFLNSDALNQWPSASGRYRATGLPVRSDDILNAAKQHIESNDEFLNAQGGAASPPKTQIIVYLAGHGVQVDRAGAVGTKATCYLAGNFNDEPALAGLLELREFANFLSTFPFSQVLIIADCCRNQALSFSAKYNGISYNNNNADSPAALLIAHAASPGMVAYETATKPIHGLFTDALLDTLESPHLFDPEGLCTASRIYPVVLESTKQRCRTLTLIDDSSHQVPHFDSEPHLSHPKEPIFWRVQPPVRQRGRLEFAIAGASPGRVIKLIGPDLAVLDRRQITDTNILSFDVDAEHIFALQDEDTNTLLWVGQPTGVTINVTI